MDKFISKLTNKPGIYKMLDTSGNIIYVGKAANLKKRVSSYFSRKNESIKTNILVENISNIEVIITKNEEEALILENTLIKKHKPKYNILLRDDKSYPYILVDTRHKFPLIKFYRGQKSPKKGFFFGPYTQVGKVRYMLNLLQKLFKIRSCENSFFSNRKKPCLQYQINRCDAPCVNLISSDSYKESITNSILLLQGKNNSIIDHYTKKMDDLSKEMKYEEASVIRDKISMIRTIAKPKDIIENQGDLDIITIAIKNYVICIDVFSTRDGINLGCKQYNFNKKDNANVKYLLTSFVKQYYLSNHPPEKIITFERIIDNSLIENILKRKYKKSIRLISATRNPYKKWIKVCQQNTDERLNYTLVKNNNINYFESISNDLHKKISNAICFDVSHISGNNTQGSAVWFDNLGPRKNMYRRYNLEQSIKSDDYGAMKEMISRRLKKLIDLNSIPDLLVVDGGKGQINVVKDIVNDLNLSNLEIIGVVKGQHRKSDNDRIISSQLKDITHTLSIDTIRNIQKMRDEAHRFAITGQRNKQLKKKYNSKLDGISGIGLQRKTQILKYFGGIQGVLKASIEELSRVPMINENLAEKIYKHLQDQ
tara:strand:+ start:2094 stop:3881 length:1788 start_codon:yes stop_codon:yes gene_type:complete